MGQASVGLEPAAMLGHGILAAGKKYLITRIHKIYGKRSVSIGALIQIHNP